MEVWLHSPFPGGDVHIVKGIGYRIVAHALFSVHIIDHLNDLGFLRLDAEAVAFHSGEFVGTVSVGSHGTHEFPHGCRLVSATHQPLVDSFQLVAAEQEFHIRELFIGFILQIEALVGGDDLAAVGLEDLHDVPNGFTCCFTLHAVSINHLRERRMHHSDHS